jgi:hypothetical protein
MLSLLLDSLTSSPTTESTREPLPRDRPTSTLRPLVSCSSLSVPVRLQLFTNMLSPPVSLITRGNVNPEGKVLIIGGGIANFTNVAATFKGIIKALKEFKQPLIDHKVKIFVRRGGTFCIFSTFGQFRCIEPTRASLFFPSSRTQLPGGS